MDGSAAASSPYCVAPGCPESRDIMKRTKRTAKTEHPKPMLSQKAAIQLYLTKNKTPMIPAGISVLRGHTNRELLTLLDKTNDRLKTAQRAIEIQDELIECLSEDERLYIPSSEAIKIATALNRKVSPSRLSKLAVEGGKIRFKQFYSKKGKPHRKIIHLKDVIAFIQTLPEEKPSGLTSNQIWSKHIDEYIQNTRKTYSIIHEAKKRKPNSTKDGYARLAKKISIHND
jgi:hypothetical protein